MKREEWAEARATLARLGYPSFKEYLASERGELVRGMVLARDGRRCRRCRRLGATQIRFTRFTEDDYTGATLDYIESVCPVCLWPKKMRGKRPHQPWSWTFHEP